MDLVSWQNKLADHFKSLQSQRLSQADGHPVFAFEHGLESNEIEDLKRSVIDQFQRSHVPSSACWLPWVVYATEFGYEYVGDEYWQTFEHRTPGWAQNEDRNAIRSFFQKFNTNFGGPKLSGAWADHFKIIAFPITNAILPKDLQWQLVKSLYDLRSTIRSEHFESPILLGEDIELSSWNKRSRFRSFVREKLLVGQIAAALLTKNTEYSSSLILPKALERIISDLEKEQSSRHWLRSAQSSVAGIELRGIAPKVSIRDSVRGGESRTFVPSHDLVLKPQLLLRPKDAVSFDVVLEIPNLLPLMTRFPAAQSALTLSRCFVQGSRARSPLARGRVLYGPLQIPLGEWPQEAIPLLKFEQSCQELEYFVSSEFLLQPCSNWLFKIGSDGVGYEIQSRIVRPGSSYVVASKTDSVELASFGRNVTLNCSGVSACQLLLPTGIDGPLQAALKLAGLDASKRISVWPIGIPPSRWDGEGSIEWLDSDPMVLGISADFASSKISMEIDAKESSSFEIGDYVPGEAFFVELPPLECGQHLVNVDVRKLDADELFASGGINVAVRKQRSWSSVAGNHGPIETLLDPPNPTLEEFWEGRAKIEVLGPVGRKIKIHFRLFDNQAPTPITDLSLPPLKLPVSTSSWALHIHNHFSQKKIVQEYYDQSDRCQVDLDGEELGFCSFTFEREFKPIRWVLKSINDDPRLYLVNHTSSESHPPINSFDYHRPCSSVPVLFSGDAIRVPPQGGLYLARTEDYQCGIIVSPTKKTFTPSELIVSPVLPRLNKTAVDICKRLESIEIWADANVSGSVIGFVQRKGVMRAIHRQIIETICGEEWTNSEQRFRENQMASIGELSKHIARRKEYQSFVVKLEKICPAFTVQPIEERVTAYANAIRSYLPIGSREDYSRRLSELSLRLSSSPSTVRRWAGASCTSDIENLFNLPVILKGARYVTLFLDAQGNSLSIDEAQLFSDWEWL